MKRNKKREKSNKKWEWSKKDLKKYYFSAYLVIQTSDPTDNQLKFTKKLANWSKKNKGVLYATIQSGKPGPPPCPPGGCEE